MAENKESMAEQLQTIENELAANPGRPYLLPSGFTAADCAMGHTLDFVSRLFGVDISPLPRVVAYFEGIKGAIRA